MNERYWELINNDKDRERIYNRLKDFFKIHIEDFQPIYKFTHGALLLDSILNHSSFVGVQFSETSIQEVQMDLQFSHRTTYDTEFVMAEQTCIASSALICGIQMMEIQTGEEV